MAKPFDIVEFVFRIEALGRRPRGPTGSIVSENMIDSFIRRIRVKLTTIDAPVTIETVRGIGFRIS